MNPLWSPLPPPLARRPARAPRPAALGFVRMACWALFFASTVGSAPSWAARPLGPPRAAAWVSVPTAAELERLRAMNLPVEDAGAPGRLLVRLSAEERAAVEAAGLRLEAAPPPPPALGLRPEALEAELRALAAQAGAYGELVELGRSRGGRPIYGLRLGQGQRARWRVLGGHHGDEASSVDLALATAAALVQRRALDPDIAALLAEDEVWVVPMVNPDGVADHERTNAQGVDLNRNYGEEWRASEWASGEAAFSEPETRAIRAWASVRGFAGGLSMHSGATNLGWVWNWTSARSPDEGLLREIAEDYAALADVPDFWITNGADWYRTFGDTTDWAYARQGTLDFTLEVSAVKAPPRDEIPGIVAEHLEAVLGFLMQPGVASGRVLDAETGRPIPATVRLVGSGARLAADPAGRFARILSADEPEVEVELSAPGYAAARLVLRAEEPQQVALQPLLRCAGQLILSPDGRLSGAGIDAPAGPVTLHRFGEPSIPVELDDPAALAALDLLPGPYDIERGGALCPRALWTAGAPADQLPLEISVVDADLELSIPDRAGAPLAFLFYGPDRAWAPVALEALGPGRFRLPAAALPAGDPHLDLLVWSGGRGAAALGVDQDPRLLPRGTAEPAGGRPARWDPEALSAYGCAPLPLQPPTAPRLGLLLGLLVSTLSLLLRRSSP